jgi:hypothetical protein
VPPIARGLQGNLFESTLSQASRFPRRCILLYS